MRKAQILVVDDEETTRFAFERFLRDAGHEVETAASFVEGVSRIAESNFDLIYADIILGGKTGVDLLREIRDSGSKCVLVLITGYPTIQTAAQAVRLGAFDYLCKPVRKDTLLRVTELALLHKSRMDADEKSHRNLDVIFNTIRDGMVMVDGDFVVAELNDAARKLLGLCHDAVGKPFESVSREGSGRCLGALVEAMEKQEPVELRHLEVQVVNSPKRVVSLTASPVFQEPDMPSGVVMVVKDESRMADVERSSRGSRRPRNIIGKSAKIQGILSLADELADVRTSVLITGESGTGKELLADAVHHGGARKEMPLVKVNCSALSESLLESELFGHVRGAFTGAVKDKIGRFQMADGGTILLDEIGDISLNIQQRLLRVLQESEFERVGDSRPIRVDVRVIAATNKDLPKKVKLGEFREDLYYRLKVVEIILPPLRERREDIPLLVAHFVEKLEKKLGKRIETVSDDVMRVFMEYPWPGNVRQLANTLEHAFVLCRQNIVTVEHLPAELKDTVAEIGAAAVVNAKKIEERETILNALEKTAWNKAMAARLLGISRRTIHRKVIEHGIMKHENRARCAARHV